MAPVLKKAVSGLGLEEHVSTRAVPMSKGRSWAGRVLPWGTTFLLSTMCNMFGLGFGIAHLHSWHRQSR